MTAECQYDIKSCRRPACAAGLGSLGSLGALGLDAGQKGGGGFVIWVLVDEVAGEGFFQDGLAQGVGAGEGGVDLGFEPACSLKPRWQSSSTSTASAILVADTQHLAGKALSHSNEKSPKRALAGC